MTLAQNLNTIIIFWAIIGGLGASLLLPAMQSLIHGNFTGSAQKRAYALVGASAAIAAAVGPLLGGFLTTYLSWRVGFGLEALIILVVLTQIRLVKDVPYTGPRQIDVVGAVLSVVGMGGVVLGILVWQEGGRYVGLLMGLGAVTLAAFAYWLVHRKRQGKPTLLDPDLFKHLNFRIGISQQMLQQITLGGAMIVLPLFLQMTLEYNAMQAGLSLAPLSLSMFGMAMLAGRKAGQWRPAQIVLAGFALSAIGMASDHPPGAESRLGVVSGDPADRRRMRSRHAGLPAQQLHARSDQRGPGQRGGRGELGGRLLRAVLRARRGRRRHALGPGPELHPSDPGQRGDPTGPTAADLHGDGARRRGHEQHRSCSSRSPTSLRRSRTRSWPSTPTPGTCSLQIALLIPAARLAPRSGQLVPDAPAPGHHPRRRHRRRRPRVNPRAMVLQSNGVPVSRRLKTGSRSSTPTTRSVFGSTSSATC